MARSGLFTAISPARSTAARDTHSRSGRRSRSRRRG